MFPSPRVRKSSSNPGQVNIGLIICHTHFSLVCLCLFSFCLILTAHIIFPSSWGHNNNKSSNVAWEWSAAACARVVHSYIERVCVCLQMMEQLTDHHYEVLTVPEESAANCVYVKGPSNRDFLLHRPAEESPDSISVSTAESSGIWLCKLFILFLAVNYFATLKWGYSEI